MSLDAIELDSGDLEIVGQLIDASNASLLCRLRHRHDGTTTQVIYKPQAGERPLWDFPDGTLSQREVAARVVAESLGWPIVPPTVWREGPFGPGMVQQWIDVDDGVDPVQLVQSDDERLRRIAVFDALINNADRKGGHLLPDSDGAVWGIDHGVTFAATSKLRTVLWQWRGLPIPPELISDLERWRREWDEDAEWLRSLKALLSEAEVRALCSRADDLLRTRMHPEPSPDWPPIPWPPF